MSTRPGLPALRLVIRSYLIICVSFMSRAVCEFLLKPSVPLIVHSCYTSVLQLSCCLLSCSCSHTRFRYLNAGAGNNCFILFVCWVSVHLSFLLKDVHLSFLLKDVVIDANSILLRSIIISMPPPTLNVRFCLSCLVTANSLLELCFSFFLSLASVTASCIISLK